MGLSGAAVNNPWRPWLGHGVEIFVAQFARNDSNWNGVGARRLGEAGYQRPRAVLAGTGGQDEQRDVVVLLDQLEDLLGDVALADDLLRCDSGNVARTRGGLRQHGARFILRFLAHDVGNAEPLLIAIERADHAAHQHETAYACAAPAREINGTIAF